MKNKLRSFVAVVTAIAFAALPLAFTGCQSDGSLSPVASTAVTAGTGLAVNAYPAAAPFVSMFANAVRAYTAKGPIPPDSLANFFAPYVSAASNLASKVSPKAGADISNFASAVLSKYRKDFPALQRGEMSVESFAAAVEAGS